MINSILIEIRDSLKVIADCLQKHPNFSMVSTDSSLTMGEWLTHWYDTYKLGKLKNSTLRSYKQLISDYIEPVIGDIPIDKLDGFKIQQLLNSIEKDNSRAKVGGLIRASLGKAVKLQMLSYNPYQAVEIPTSKSKHYKPLDFNMQNAVLKELENPRYSWVNKIYLSVFWVLCCCGMRIGEFLALDWYKDIDYTDMVITIDKSLDTISNMISSPKSESGYRQIPFRPMLILHLKQITDYYAQGHKLTYYSIRLHFKRLYERLNYKGYNLHSFRHTFISLCYYCGMREKYIQQYAGHSDIDVTLNIYTHILKKGNSPLLEYIRQLKTDLQ